MNNNGPIVPGNLQLELLNSLSKNADKPAFFFGDTCFLYKQLLENISHLQRVFPDNGRALKPVGIITNNDFDTYSAIITCLLSGITYVPIEPSHPDERNNHIIQLSSLDSIYSSDMTTLSRRFRERHSLKFLTGSKYDEIAKQPFITVSNSPAYILFTSGTTGLPKGVPITCKNLEAFTDSIYKMGVEVTCEDRFLQFIDLTFDLSLSSFLIPLLHGACIYPLPKAPVKYMAAVQLIEDKAITHVTTVPSFAAYLEPYFKEISLRTIKYWFFSGEALKTRYVEGWQKCVPNGRIFNVYGPTEATVFCSSYRCKVNNTKDRHGIVCIGKPFEGTSFALITEDNQIAENGFSGELCIAGRQLTAGYLDGDVKNKKAFFDYDGSTYYRTGDICSVDAEGDYFFEGRNDSQIKIDGYRIELGEIENTALAIRGITNAVAIAVNEAGSVLIVLFLIGQAGLHEINIRDYLKTKIPDYMIPRKFIFIGSLPLNLNGKTDKKTLLDIYEQNR